MLELERYRCREETKVGGRGGSREDDGKPCWFSSFRGGVPEEKEEAEEDRGKEARD